MKVLTKGTRAEGDAAAHKDGTIFDVEAPALFLTPTGVQLLWPREVNRFCSTLEQAV